MIIFKQINFINEIETLIFRFFFHFLKLKYFQMQLNYNYILRYLKCTSFWNMYICMYVCM